MRKGFKTIIGIMIAAMIMIGGSRAMADASIVYEAAGAGYGMALYNSQVIIGITADAFYYDVYSVDEAMQIIAEQEGGLDVMKDYARKMAKDPAIPALEAQTMDEIVYCIDLLFDTINSLEDYIDVPDDVNTNDFHEKRMTSYYCIAELLGIED